MNFRKIPHWYKTLGTNRGPGQQPGGDVTRFVHIEEVGRGELMRVGLVEIAPLDERAIRGIRVDRGVIIDPHLILFSSQRVFIIVGVAWPGVPIVLILAEGCPVFGHFAGPQFGEAGEERQDGGRHCQAEGGSVS